VSEDGSRFALGLTDGTAWLLDTGAEPRWRPLIGAGYALTALAFSSDARRLAAGTKSFLRVFDCDACTQLGRVSAGEVLFRAFEYDDARRLLISAAGDLEIRDAATNKILFRQTALALKTQQLGQSFDMARIPSAAAPAAGSALDMGRIAIVADDGTTQLLDSSSCRLLGSFANVGKLQTSIAAPRHGAALLTCNRVDDTLRLWTTEPLDSEVLGEIDQTIYPLAVSPDGLLLATGAWDGMARLWEIPGGRQVAALSSGSKRVEAVAFSPDGRTLACGLGISGLATWDLVTGRQVGRLQNVKSGAVAFSPDGSRLACGDGNAVLLLDPATLQERLALRPIGNYTTAIAWSPDGRLLAAGSRDGILSLRDPSTGAELTRVTGSRGGTWEWTGVRALSFSPDGKRLASGWGSSELIVYDVPLCAAPLVLPGARGELFGVAWSPDGSRIAAGGRDNLLRLWNPDTGGLMLSLPGHADYIYSVAFTPDGRRIVTTSGDHTLRLWDTAPAAQRWQEKARANRERTELEPVVDALLAQTGEAGGAAERLATRTDLDAEQRRIALDLVLEKARKN
jgi:WD40 repeat protein